MGHLFLDIETYIDRSVRLSALNPYLPESKVILIAYNYYSGDTPPAKSEIKPPMLLKEWESGEANMLKEFLNTLRELGKKDSKLRIHGFNILKFDLPYLFGRMKVHNIAEEKELHDLFFGVHATDILQVGSIISDDSRQKEQLWDISQEVANRFFGLQMKEGVMEQCSRYYDAKDYDKIEDYCRQEFRFEQLLNSFYLYIQNLKHGKI